MALISPTYSLFFVKGGKHQSKIINQFFQSCQGALPLVGNLNADSHLELLQHNEMPKNVQRGKNEAR